MLVNFIIGLSVMVLCLLLQTILLLLAKRNYLKKVQEKGFSSFWDGFILLNGAMTLLIIGNVLQIMIWGGLFQLLGEFSQYHDAVYHSAVNFATLGYGDIVMSDKHKLLGPLESINGIIMIGVSTAALMSAFQNIVIKMSKDV